MKAQGLSLIGEKADLWAYLIHEYLYIYCSLSVSEGKKKPFHKLFISLLLMYF